MIKIGDFARLGRVSVVTLGYYDDVGLLRPVAVDPFTAYRYYSASQLARLNRIIALKDLGFSLKQIEQVLDGLTLEQLAGMLKMKQAQSRQLVADEQARLTRIAARLKQIEMEETMSDYEVILKDTPAVLIAARQVTVPTNDQVPRYLGQAFGETYSAIKTAGAREAAPCLAIWHQAADVYTNEVVEAAVPTDRSFAAIDPIRVYELPPARVASVIHQGDFANMYQAHVALLAWMEANGYRAAGGYREIYLHEGAPNPADAVTEIQYPVERAS
jgi:DNA-binding transcriptional MerR regulator